MEVIVTQYKVLLCWYMPGEGGESHATLQSWERLRPGKNYNHAPAECKSKYLLTELAWSVWFYV